MVAGRLHSGAPRVADPWNVFGGGTPSAVGDVRPLAGFVPAAGRPERRDSSSMRRIGEILVGAGVITIETRDRVLEYQEWNHVSFGTALLESGALPEQLFLRALSVQYSVPAASAAELESIPPDVLALVKRRVADRSSVIPLRKVGRTLHLAMARPNDRVAIRSVALLTGLAVVPHVAIAFRLALALEKHYGIPAAAHFRAVAEALDAKTTAAAGSGEAGAEKTGPIAPGPTATGPAPEPRSPAPRPPAPVPWSRLTAALAEVRSPDELARTLLEFLRDAAGPSALYLRRGDEAVLWQASPAASGSSDRPIPLSERSLLATLRDSNDLFTGPCPGTSADRRLLASVGGRFPADLFVVPVNLNRRTFLYVVGKADRGTAPLDRASLRRLARIASTALGLVALQGRLRSVGLGAAPTAISSSPASAASG